MKYKYIPLTSKFDLLSLKYFKIFKKNFFFNPLDTTYFFLFRLLFIFYTNYLEKTITKTKQYRYKYIYGIELKPIQFLNLLNFALAKTDKKYLGVHAGIFVNLNCN